MARQGLNRVMVLGFLGQIPELKFTREGKAVAKVSVAVDERWKDSEGMPPEPVVEAVLEVHAKREEIRGLEIVSEPEFLRHFSARFRPLAGA